MPLDGVRLHDGCRVNLVNLNDFFIAFVQFGPILFF